MKKRHSIHLLLAAAALLAQTRDFAGSVVLIFQPGEEGWAGADKMIKDGLFERYPCREVFAIHGAPSRPLGTVAVREGAMTASVDIAYMTVEGRGGHGARPQETIDPMPAAAELILALQTIVARNINPADSAVVSCCFVQAGDPLAPTVIPQRVNLSAKTGWHTNRLANAMRGALASWDKRIPTGKLNAFLGKIQAAHPHPLRGGKQPRILFATQASTRPPRFVIFATGFLEHGYRRYIERCLREEFGFEGSPIQISVNVREKKKRK